MIELPDSGRPFLATGQAPRGRKGLPVLDVARGVGLSLHACGAAEVVASGLMAVTEPCEIAASLLALGCLTVVLTEPVSNAAAALSLLPVAIASAEILVIEARPAAVMVASSALLSFFPAALTRTSDHLRPGPLPILQISSAWAGR